MGKVLIITGVTVLIFFFLWFTVGRPLLRMYLHNEPDLEPIKEDASAEELKQLRTQLEARKAKLKNKVEIAKVQDQLNEVNAKLADLV